MIFVQFIGAVRSGHNFVGQLINAHRRAVISNEINTIRMFKENDPPREKLHQKIMFEADQFVQRGADHVWYNFDIGHYQGKTTEYDVIGDSYCGNFVKKLKPEQVSDYEIYTGCELRFIWVMRHPVDQVISFTRFDSENVCTSPLKYTGVFMGQYEYANKLCTKAPTLILTYNRLINEPQETLETMLEFLRLDDDEEYFEACKKKIFAKPVTYKDHPEYGQLKEILHKYIIEYETL